MRNNYFFDKNKNDDDLSFASISFKLRSASVLEDCKKTIKKTFNKMFSTVLLEKNFGEHFSSKVTSLVIAKQNVPTFSKTILC